MSGPTFIPVVADEQATGHLAEIYDRWKAANPGRDRMPAVLTCFSHRPDFLEGIIQWSYGLHFRDGHLTRLQKEMIGTYVSALNRCAYCAGSHAYFLEVQPGGETLAPALHQADLDAAGLALPERRLLEYCGRLTTASHTATGDDVAELRRLGWTDSQIAEAVYITGMFALFNRVANAFGLPDPNYREILGGKDLPPLAPYQPEADAGATHR